MSLVWPVVLAVSMGVLCSTGIRLLHFMVIAFIAALGSAFSMRAGGLDVAPILLNLLIVLTALEGGYFVGLLARARRTDPSRDKWNSGGPDELSETLAA